MTTYRNWMQRALALAQECAWVTAPNPRVGCVIVRDDQVLGQGVTQRAGGHHAEVQAIQDAQSRGYDVRGATVYVTLEPCCHFGKTPPCTDALIHAGISKVVAALEDPNPLVAGQGLATLRAAGIDVVCGVMADQARETHIGFLTRMRTGQPWVRMKVAASLDGRTALQNGQSQWITSPAAREDGHRWRARADAVVTGIGTVQKDDPQLTVRLASFLGPQPRRIVVDSRLEIDLNARVLVDGAWVATATENCLKIEQLRDRGVEVLVLPNEQGKVDLPALMNELGRRQINEVHVEAGHRLNGALVRAHCVDELLLYLAPTLLGDAVGMMDLGVLTQLQQGVPLVFHEVQLLGDALRVLARFKK